MLESTSTSVVICSKLLSMKFTTLPPLALENLAWLIHWNNKNILPSLLVPFDLAMTYSAFLLDDLSSPPISLSLSLLFNHLEKNKNKNQSSLAFSLDKSICPASDALYFMETFSVYCQLVTRASLQLSCLGYLLSILGSWNTDLNIASVI